MSGTWLSRVCVRKAEILIVGFVAITLVGLGIAFMRAYPVYSTVSDNAVIPKIREGSDLSSLPGYQWSSHPKTLVLALHVGCPYCEASMGFYSKLQELEAHSSLSAHILAVFNDPPADVAGEMLGSLATLQTLSNIDFAILGIGSTPTILLVSSSGKAERIWRGQLSAELENQVLLVVGQTSSDRRH